MWWETRIQDTRVYQEAQEEKAQEIALNLLREGGFSIEIVSRTTGLSIAEVQALQSQLEQESH
jgi:predicted transposase YdaD